MSCLEKIPAGVTRFGTPRMPWGCPGCHDLLDRMPEEFSSDKKGSKTRVNPIQWILKTKNHGLFFRNLILLHSFGTINGGVCDTQGMGLAIRNLRIYHITNGNLRHGMSPLGTGFSSHKRWIFHGRMLRTNHRGPRMKPEKAEKT